MAENLARLLLTRGYFPDELPPPFDTERLGQTPNSIAWDALFESRGNSGGANHEHLRIEVANYHLARQGSLRRRLGLPHPVAYARLAERIERAFEPWLAPTLQRSTMNKLAITPNRGERGRAFPRAMGENKRAELRAEVQSCARYLLVADIQSFYASVYTHALGWALAGKAEAKSRARGPKATRSGVPPHGDLGAAEEIDRALRAMQDGQSIGVPIGPDASLVVTEVLLASVDVTLQEEMERRGAKGARFVDDYAIGTWSLQDAEELLAVLQTTLRERLELELNPRKTRIIALPAAIETPWVTTLKGIFREGATSSHRQQRRDLLRLFDLATAARARWPEEHVYTYALGILKHVAICDEVWPLLESLLLQAMLSEPGLVQRIVVELRWYAAERGRRLDRARIGAALRQIIRQHAHQGHSSEVAWGLWGHVELGIDFELSASDDGLRQGLERMAASDPVVATLLLYLQHEAGLAFDATRIVQAKVSPEGFWGSMWLPVYEGCAQGWLDATALATCDAYQTLSDAGVRFFAAARRVDPADKSRVLPVPGSYANAVVHAGPAKGAMR